MTDAPIDLAAAKAARDERRNGPDADQVCVIVKDGKPEKWFKFDISFGIDGTRFSFHIWALDWADAQRRVQAIKSTATLDGQIMSEIVE